MSDKPEDDGDLLTIAYLSGVHDERKAWESRLGNRTDELAQLVAWLRADLIEEYGETCARQQAAWHYAAMIESGAWKEQA